MEEKESRKLKKKKNSKGSEWKKTQEGLNIEPTEGERIHRGRKIREEKKENKRNGE